MFSRILIKLIDQSIIPAVLLVAARIASLALVANYFNIKFNIGSNGFLYANENDYVLVNSYSLFFMVILLSIGLFYILLKSLIFHDTHIAPHMTARLFSLNLSSVIQNSFEIYSQASVWLSYLFLILLTSGIMAFYGILFGWVFYTALTLTVLATVLFVFDMENELDLNKEQKPEETEDVILEFKEE
ncbi:MAG TPA: hypothetical protein VJG85_01345 [Patescibacteria group bacterium]|nr:hypothetical protein [Patescibacteria group bacterium]